MPPSVLIRLIHFSVTTALAASLAPYAAFAAEEDQLLIPPTPKERAFFELLFLPDGRGAMDAPLRDGERRVLVTGAYSSGDRFAPEGFVLEKGDASRARIQGWDGLLLIDGAGRASLHDVSHVRYRGAVYDLRERAARRAFIDLAGGEELSAVQSHLLINEGALDLKPADDAPRFRRRLLFETWDGRIGVYDSSPNRLTLYEAAEALRAAQAPRFAFNLDMGNYDFCENQTAGGVKLCGLLPRSGIDKLTNLIAITVSDRP